MSDEGEWILIGLDEKMARRQGMPARLPGAQGEFEGLADKGLAVDTARAVDQGLPHQLRARQERRLAQEERAGGRQPRGLPRQGAALGQGPEGVRRERLREGDLGAQAHHRHGRRRSRRAAQPRLGARQPRRPRRRRSRASRPSARRSRATPTTTSRSATCTSRCRTRTRRSTRWCSRSRPSPTASRRWTRWRSSACSSRIYENPRDAASLTYVRADSVVEYLDGQWDAEQRERRFFLEQLAYHERERRHERGARRGRARDCAAQPDAGRRRARRARPQVARAARARPERRRAGRGAGATCEQGARARPALRSSSRDCLAAGGKVEEARAEVDARARGRSRRSDAR